MRVVVLPKAVIQRIASGEVIDSPVAAVRELVENSLDAAATQIDIEVDFENGDLSVLDNGCGMRPPDLVKCIEQNATSKLRSLEELERGQVRTLGFRGQGLWAVSQLCESIHMRTASEGSPCGSMIEYSTRNEGPISIQPAAMPQGTFVQVKGLFQDEQFAARRASMPPKSQSRQQLLSFVQATALCHPSVSWRVREKGRSILVLFGNHHFLETESEEENAKRALIRVFSQVTHIAPEECGASCSGNVFCVLGYPDLGHHRARADAVTVAVNGRAVQNVDLQNIVLNYVRRSVPSGRFPIIFVHLKIPSEEVDWNIRPMKTEMRLKNLDSWAQQIRESIDRCFSIPLSQFSLTDSLTELYLGNAAEAEDSVMDDLAEPDEDSRLLPLKVVAQVANTYILATNPQIGDLWIIEQHTAHERVLYENFMGQAERLTSDSVELANPIILRAPFTQSDVELMRDKFGIGMSIFGPMEWKVERVPRFFLEVGIVHPALGHERSASTQNFQYVLQSLKSANGFEDQIAFLACRAAVKNGNPLNSQKMQWIVDSWLKTDAPRTCPHGRPTFRQLKIKDLEMFFRRRYTPRGSNDNGREQVPSRHAAC
jgi:DNA mismatch repair protein MutL